MSNAEPHPLDMPRAKLARAAQHIHMLNAHCERYSRDRSWLEVRYAGDEHAYDVVLRTKKHPPLFLGLILGDVIQNLRSSLDLMTWQLVLDHDPEALDNRRVARRISFPIHQARAEFMGCETVKHVSEETVERMVFFQPFRNIERGDSTINPLTLLQRLSNSDKHQVLVPAISGNSIDDFRIQPHPATPLDMDNVVALHDPDIVAGDDTPLFRIPITDPDAAPSLDHARAWFDSEPSVHFPVDGVGWLRLEQISDMLDVAWRVIEGVGAVYFPALAVEDIEERMPLWVMPELEPRTE